MRKQIVRIFHNIRGKVNSSSGQSKEDVQPAADLSAQESYLWDGEDSGGVNERSGSEPMEAADQDGFLRLLERKDFEKIVNENLGAAGKQGCLLIGDVDRFREINDIYGHDMGNAVLKYVVNVLLDTFEECEYIARQGSDTFAMWLSGVSPEQEDQLRMQAGKVNDRLLHPAVELPPVTLSIGIAYDGSGEDCRSLGRKAVKALNRVKESGRCGCEVYGRIRG